MSAAYFDAMYQAAADPWGFEDRWYEQRKYAIGMALPPCRPVPPRSRTRLLHRDPHPDARRALRRGAVL
jgi:hypothetical protein